MRHPLGPNPLSKRARCAAPRGKSRVVSSPAQSQPQCAEERTVAAGNAERGRCMKEPMMGRSRRIIELGYLQVTRIKRVVVRGGQVNNEPSSPSSRTSAQSYPNAKSVRGSSLPASAGGFWSRVGTRVLLPVEGWSRTRTFFAGIENWPCSTPPLTRHMTSRDSISDVNTVYTIIYVTE